MRLIKLKLNRFRRFANEESLDLNEDLIALVGPNEAGKSSILDALDLLNRNRFPSGTDTTRGMSGSATVQGLFVLEAGDREAVAAIHGAESVTHAWVEHGADDAGELWTLEPPPQRDLSPRRRCAKLVVGLRGDPALDSQFSSNEEEPWDPQLLDDAESHLQSSEETLPDAGILACESLAKRLRDLDYPPGSSTESDQSPSRVKPADLKRKLKREETASALVDLAELERQPSPEEQAIELLSRRLPTFLAFREEHRELRADYQLAEVAENPPEPLGNLCKMAELDLAAVWRHVQTGGIPQVEKWFEEANLTLKERFRGKWSQSTIYPRLSTPGSDGVLRVYFSTEGETAYSYPDERSDGLRWFFALQAFLEARGAARPILLVDEAETHLHYDAQADLIDVLMNQTVASKVIYTTHSVGCLPPDLGCGVRAILQREGSEHSHIVNNYWLVNPQTDDRVGYGPLLFAMGARLLALTVPRFAVIAEGPSDAVLLPSLMREATGLPRLQYRIVPGLSELAHEQLPRIRDHGGRVVCLTDGDESGKKVCRQLISAGVPSEVTFDLGCVTRQCTLEDLVRPGIFARAVNTELETWNLGTWRVDESVIPRVGRWRWLIEEGSRNGVAITRLSKVRVAQRIVDLGRPKEPEGPPAKRLSPTTRKRLSELHSAILTAMEA